MLVNERATQVEEERLSGPRWCHYSELFMEMHRESVFKGLSPRQRVGCKVRKWMREWIQEAEEGNYSAASIISSYYRQYTKTCVFSKEQVSPAHCHPQDNYFTDVLLDWSQFTYFYMESTSLLCGVQALQEHLWKSVQQSLYICLP